MRRTKDYQSTVFPAEVLKQGHDKFVSLLPPLEKGIKRHMSHSYTVGRGHEKWSYDSIEEFLADYRGGCDSFYLREDSGDLTLELNAYGQTVQLSVSAKSSREIATIFEQFDSVAEKYQVLPDEVSPTIFIGHGHSKLWRDLKDHLHEQHGYDVEAYETGARAGHAVRDVLEDMLDESSFAILVMTAEDEMGDGKFRARQNVVHEAGLFQGRLGFPRAIVLREAGTEEFSNLAGINELQFSKGNIKEVFGDVVATLRREFLDFNPAIRHAKAA